ncbi:phosphoenolpyruvate--protein phosphotransferase [Deltaproteobacteria bacterium TL4]
MNYDNLSSSKSTQQILAEVSRIITSSHDASETLAQTARMVAKHLKVDACSIYVYSAEEEALVLKATFGLNASAVETVKMPLSEGLVGLVMELSEPVQVAEMYRHPRFKYFPQTNEDNFSSFLGVPLIEHRKTFGVLVVHTCECRNFTEAEEEILITIASQVASFITKALLIKQLDLSSDQYDEEKNDPLYNVSSRIKGAPIAPGYALGKAILLQQTTLEEPERKSDLSVQEEILAFKEAQEHAITDLLEVIDKVSEYLPPEEAAIFHVHLMFLEDRGFIEKIERNIEMGTTAVWAIYDVVHEYLRAFEAIDDPYLKEKGSDLKDVGNRLLHYFGHGSLSITQKEGILVTRQLLPGDVVRLDPRKIKGLITSSGGAVSHAAIVARSLLIPAICIPEHELEEIEEGDRVALDGKLGYAIINPEQKEISEFQNLLLEQNQYRDYLEKFRDHPCITLDGYGFSIHANIGMPSELSQLAHYGAEGVGLFRSEIYFLSLDAYPSIQQQTSIYAKVVASVYPPQFVVFRTLDIGADKAAPYMGFALEENPFLGYRALRRQLQKPEVLKSQIKAILLSALNQSHVKILFPMISQLTEWHQAKQIYRDCRKELEQQGHQLPHIPLGMMFEIPAAVLMCDQFMKEIDFGSIGSNDLTQYIMAVDRNNPMVTHLYDPLHPAVLKMIHTLVQSAHRHNKPLELCGEMASDPDGCIILLGLGVTRLSMNAPLIPVVKARLTSISIETAQELAQFALQASSAEEVRTKIAEVVPILPLHS